MMNKPRLLIIDDDEFMRRMLQRIVEPVSDRAEVEGCARSALARLDQPDGRPNIIILDLKMPDIDGVQFARILSERGFDGSVILISGTDERILQTTTALLRRQTIDVLGYFKKPVLGSDLQSLIENWRPKSNDSVSFQARTFSADVVRAALEQGQLFNVYQPKVRFIDGVIGGFETLVRWQHPEHGVLAPDSFLPQLTSSDDLRQLTRTVIARAFSDTAEWLHSNQSPSLAINVTMEDMQHNDFAQTVSEMAEQHRIPPHKVTIEVTESSNIDESLRAIDSATSLRIMGFSLSIDDFGTGHSTMSQLQDMPFNELKIDRSFVTGADIDSTRSSILKASVDLAKQLGMHVVAEGIETQTDWEFAKQAGCDYAQGYFISRPLTPDLLPSWQTEWNGRATRLINH